jgi:hypothetical protein
MATLVSLNVDGQGGCPCRDALGSLCEGFCHRHRPPGQAREVVDVDDSGHRSLGFGRRWVRAGVGGADLVHGGAEVVRAGVSGAPGGARAACCQEHRPAPGSSGISRKPWSASFNSATIEEAIVLRRAAPLRLSAANGLVG